jgi:SAM-dependent methyltransferase
MANSSETNSNSLNHGNGDAVYRKSDQGNEETFLYPFNVASGITPIEVNRLDFQHTHVIQPAIGGTGLANFLPIGPREHVLSITKSSDRPAAIADVATGTAIWLRDIAPLLPKDTKLVGFDIDTSKFALLPREMVPSNLELYGQDMLQPFPKQFHGVFDVVHVRSVHFALKKDQWLPHLKHLADTLLRPGGWLLCEEFVLPGLATLPMTERFSKYLGYQHEYDLWLGRDPISSLHISKHMREAGLHNVSQELFHSVSCDDENVDKAVTKMLTAVMDSLLKRMVSEGIALEGMSSLQDVGELVNACLEDGATGRVRFNLAWIWVAGQKPL